MEIQVSGASRAGASKDWLHQAVSLVLRTAGLSEGEISLTLLDDDSIRELNRTYLGEDVPTDVISFALHEGDDHAGIAEYWILNLDDLQLEVSRHAHGASYAERQTVSPGNRIAPLARPDCPIAIDDLLP